MCGRLCQSMDDPQISQIVGPLELECGATMCGYLCQSRDVPWISQLGIRSYIVEPPCVDIFANPWMIPRSAK